VLTFKLISPSVLLCLAVVCSQHSSATTRHYPQLSDRLGPFSPEAELVATAATGYPGADSYLRRQAQLAATAVAAAPFHAEPSGTDSLVVDLIAENDRLRQELSDLRAAACVQSAQAAADAAAPVHTHTASASTIITAAETTGHVITDAATDSTVRLTTASLHILHKYVECSQCAQWLQVPAAAVVVQCAVCSSSTACLAGNTHMPSTLELDRPPPRPWGMLDWLRRAIIA
jgi:LSD1 subclass zinc finger protein